MLCVGSLFAGIGGFDEGFRRAGMSTAWACEIAPKARAVLRRHFPHATIYHDVKELRGEALEPVDLLCGGFPCQDLSVAGRRAGFAGERSGLFFEIVRLIDELTPRPRWVVLENVPGLLSSRGRRDMGAVVRALEERGYGLGWRVFDSRYFRVPQQRRRVFFVGYLGDWRHPAQVLFEPESLRWDTQTRRKTRKEVAGTLGGGSGSRGWNDDLDRSGAFIPEKALACVAKGGSGRMDATNETFIARTITESTRRDDRGDGGNLIHVGTLCATGKAAGSATQQDAERNMLVVHALSAEGADASEDGTGRGTPLVVSLSPGDRGISVDQACGNMVLPVSVSLGSDPSHALDQAHPLTGRNGDPGVIAFHAMQDPVSGELSPAIGQGSPSGQCTTAVMAFDTTQVTSKENRCRPEPGKPCHPLAAGAYAPAVALSIRGREGGAAAELGSGVSHAMRSSQGGSDKPHVLAQMRVRRLMPVECERLQAFPDGWTRWGVPDGGGIADMKDGPRYKMLGNAVTVTVPEWLGRRIMGVEAAMQEIAS